MSGFAKALLAGSALFLIGDAVADPGFTGEHMPYAAFDGLATTPIDVGASVLNVGFAPGDLALPRETILDWLRRSARAVSIYYGHFPVRSARILIVPVPGRGVQKAQAFGYRGPAIRMMVGTGTTEADLMADWKAVHEMVHLALPEVDEQQLWFAEGLAVYIESIARVQAGDLTAEKIWSDFVRDMPKGLPGPGDGGLDVTHSWGRTYWGGAIFCLLADVEIRKRTENRTGLQQAMRGVVEAQGDMSKRWPFKDILSTADAATGEHVLTTMYDTFKSNPEVVDLENVWRSLGIKRAGDTVEFDDTAPLASIRRAITAFVR